MFSFRKPWMFEDMVASILESVELLFSGTVKMRRRFFAFATARFLVFFTGLVSSVLVLPFFYTR